MRKLVSEANSEKGQQVALRARRIVALGKMYGIPVRHREAFEELKAEVELLEAAVRLIG